MAATSATKRKERSKDFKPTSVTELITLVQSKKITSDNNNINYFIKLKKQLFEISILDTELL